MRRILLITITFIVSFHSANAQWYQVNTNTTANLYDIFFVDSLEGYCVGGSDNWGTPQSTGVILKTLDGGENWNTIFSKDSLTIMNLAIVEVSGNKKLFAFGIKNGASYLVSTFINTPIQNWAVTSIGYKPKEVKVYNNEIYFVDEMDYLLKKLTNGTLQNVTSQTVSIFDINTYGLLFVNENADRIFYSADLGITIDTLNHHPVQFGENQLSSARVFLSEDYYLIYGTYSRVILASFNDGITWQYNYVNYNLPVVLNENNIIAFEDNQLLKSNYNQSFTDTLANINMFPLKIIISNNNSGYIIGKSGNIYKSGNIGTVGINESDLKKKINIFPNPTKDVLQIEVSDDTEIEGIELFDIEGKRVKIFNKIDTSLNISALSSGTYFLKFSTGEGVLIKKVVIE